MGKATRSRRARAQRPRPPAPVARIVLAPADFEHLRGVCAIAELTLRRLQAQLAVEIAAAQAPAQQLLTALAQKYPGLEAGAAYAFEPATCTLVRRSDP